MEPSYIYRAEVLRVIDGDTYDLRVDLGFRAALTISGRLHGANSPELSTQEGLTAKAYAESVLPVGRQVVIQSYRDRQSFARWVVDIWLPHKEKSLATMLVEAGFAEAIK